MKKLTLITITSVIALLTFSINLPSFNTLNEASAKSKFSSRSFSSRSFSYKSSSRKSSGSSGLWNRSSGYKKSISKPSTSSGYSKSSKSPSVNKIKKFSTQSYTTQAAQRSISVKSLNSHRKQNSVFKKTAPTISTSTIKTNPIASRVGSRKTSYRTYYSRRDNYWNSRRWNRPVYVTYSQPYFGVWDAVFMWSMLDLHRDWAYHHRNDPGYQQWRQEANRLAVDNEELRNKLAVLDADVKKMEGTPINNSYLPKGVSSDIALAAPVVASATGDLEVDIGTGGLSGNYYSFCNQLKERSKDLKVNCVNTKGSVENLDGLVKGRFGAAMIQSDVLNSWLRDNPNVKIQALQADVYPEVVFMLVNKNTKINSIKELIKKDPKINKHRIYFAGSGAAKTVRGLANADTNYAPLASKGIELPADEDTLIMVANNPNGILFYVCGLKCGLIEKADLRFGKQLQIAAVDDWDFNDQKDQFGNRIYNFVEIPRVYKNLMPSHWVSSDNIETLAVSAIFVVSRDWTAEKGAKGLSALETATWPAMAAIQKKVGVPE